MEWVHICKNQQNHKVRKSLQLLGVSATGFKIDFLKISIWLHPDGLHDRARLLLKICLKYDEKKKNVTNLKNHKIKVFFKGESCLRIQDLFDESDKLNQEYLGNIGSEYSVDGKIEKRKETEIIVIKNLPSIHAKDKSYEVMSEGDIPIELEFDPFSKEKAGMLMISMILRGEIIDREHIFKRLVGISRFAWRFQFRMWGQKEHAFPGEADLGSCQEAQTYVIIPEIFFKSKGHLSLSPGGDQMHIIGRSDIPVYTKSLEGEKKEKDSTWMKPGSCGISWGGARNIMSISRDICVEHPEAFPRALTVLFLIQFWAALAFGIGTIWYRGESFTSGDLVAPGIFFLILSIISYFWVNIKNYSFYELNFPGSTRFLHRTLSILTTCVLSSVTFFTLVNEITGRLNSSTLYIFFCFSLIAFLFFNFRNESEAELRRTKTSGRIVGPEIRTLLFLFLIVFISFVFSRLSFENNKLYDNFLVFWMINNFASSAGQIYGWGRSGTASES